jgi:subtilisin family serine protease
MIVIRSTRVGGSSLAEDPFAVSSRVPVGTNNAVPGTEHGSNFSVAVVEYANAKDLADAKRDPDNLHIPPMPTLLIEPRETINAGFPPKKNWGIHAVKALSSPYTGAGVTVAVLDTGIDKSHPAFADIELVMKNFTDEADGDFVGHGTHCAGTIFGRDVEGLRIGVARGVSKAFIGKVIKKSGGGTTDQIVEAINWAKDSGAHVISMSVGIDYAGYCEFLKKERKFPPEVATSLAHVDGEIRGAGIGRGTSADAARPSVSRDTVARPERQRGR